MCSLKFNDGTIKLLADAIPVDVLLDFQLFFLKVAMIPHTSHVLILYTTCKRASALVMWISCVRYVHIYPRRLLYIKHDLANLNEVTKPPQRRKQAPPPALSFILQLQEKINARTKSPAFRNSSFSHNFI